MMLKNQIPFVKYWRVKVFILNNTGDWNELGAGNFRILDFEPPEVNTAKKP